MHQREILYNRSIRILQEYQHRSGAFTASPNFSQYGGYCWLRDGSFCAYALILTGNHKEAERFITWATGVVNKFAYKVDALESDIENITYIMPSAYLAARYTLEGGEDDSSWPNHQIDGYGTLLWCVAEYLRATGTAKLPGFWETAMNVCLRYLSLVWNKPCSDCWEEFPDRIHPSTLASVAGGLTAAGGLGSAGLLRQHAGFASLAEKVRTFLFENLHPEGRFPKSVGYGSVDASLLWLALPFGVVDYTDPAMVNTVREIEKKLLEKGGVKRYPEDTYFGGGQWIILSAWLAWYYVKNGRTGEAKELMDWILSCQDRDGFLPEQVSSITNDPSMFGAWEKKWGKVASPLLWSHAMFLILDQELKTVS